MTTTRNPAVAQYIIYYKTSAHIIYLGEEDGKTKWADLAKQTPLLFDTKKEAAQHLKIRGINSLFAKIACVYKGQTLERFHKKLVASFYWENGYNNEGLLRQRATRSDTV